MVFWNPKKRRTTAKPKTTASISKPKVGSVKQELNILPQPKKTDNPKPNKVPKNEDVKKQFLKTFNQLTYRHRSWDDLKRIWRSMGFWSIEQKLKTDLYLVGENPDGC